MKISSISYQLFFKSKNHVHGVRIVRFEGATDLGHGWTGDPTAAAARAGRPQAEAALGRDSGHRADPVGSGST